MRAVALRRRGAGNRSRNSGSPARADMGVPLPRFANSATVPAALDHTFVIVAMPPCTRRNGDISHKIDTKSEVATFPYEVLTSVKFLRKHNGTSAFRSFGTYPYRGEPDCDPVRSPPHQSHPPRRVRTITAGRYLACPRWVPRRSSAPPRHRPGPRIFDVATELSLTEGYGATSIEAVAQHARMSKRTFYPSLPG